MWYLLYILIDSAFVIGLHAGKHGEPRKEEYNVRVAIFTVAFSWVLLWVSGALKALVALGW